MFLQKAPARWTVPGVPRRKTQTTPRLDKTASWALVPIDARPIRDKARQDYQKVLRDLQQARHEIERFETQDKPGFDQWLNRQFGTLLTELRQTTQKLQASRELLFEIESEAFLAECSHVRAYERVMWRRQHPEPEEQADAEPTDRIDEDDSDGANPFAGFEEFFADLDEDFAEYERQPGKGRLGPEGKSAPRLPARLKELYRAVVRRLHPDKHEKLNTQRAEWWHQAQAAYQSGDVEQLEVILTLCEIEEQGSTAKTSVSLLMRITRQFKSSLRTLKAQLQKYRRDPAWNFKNLRSRGDLLDRTERLLQAELAELRHALEAIEAQIGSWARQADMARRRPTRRRRYPTGQPEFLF
jgi:hypothetical protein